VNLGEFNRMSDNRTSTACGVRRRESTGKTRLKGQVMKRIKLIAALLVVGSVSLAVVHAVKQEDEATARKRAQKLQKDGNIKEAYEAFSRLALDEDSDVRQVGGDLSQAVQCLRRLNRTNETDAFREKVIKVHGKNWRLLRTAADTYLNDQHYGYIVAGEYHRGHHRGGGKYVASYERDRVRALQLMEQALAVINGDNATGPERGGFYWDLARMMLGNRSWGEAWRLGYLTDLTKLPDYNEGGHGRWGYRGGQSRAPVDEEGNAIFHKRPRTWKAAETDGERWRWALLQVAEHDPSRTAQVDMHFAGFLHNQFGVQTMAEYGWFFGRTATDDEAGKKGESGTWQMHTLGEDETIARLATGIKRFTMPDEFNYVRIYRKVAAGRSGHASSAFDVLGSIFQNRKQFPEAAKVWRKQIDRFGSTTSRQRRLKQIVANWGTFEPVVTQPSGAGATVEFRFRNGKKLSIEARRVDVKTLLEDVKAYIKTRPKRLDHNQLNIQNIGYRLVYQNQAKYVGDRVAAWDLDLEPRPNHFDRRITIATPLQKAGAYLVTAKMEGGNVSRILLWVADTAIVKKQLNGKTFYFVADAVTGKPIAKANLEFFGFWQEYKSTRDGKNRRSWYEIHTSNFAEFTDADGQLILPNAADRRRYQWVITATTPGGRLAYLGYTSIWGGSWHDAQYKATKTFVITDRPVYRPEQTVKFKFWVNQAQYDREGDSPYAGRNFVVRVNDPKGQKILEKTYKADKYGGFDGQIALKKNATLGVYRVHLPNSPGGGSSFRVEEYKKPEFEVKVDAPSEPVALGEKIEATITAKYYFGAPVTEGKVKYKVLRSSHTEQWYPVCYWDWFYGPGYWWYAYDYAWYPGWREWGCKRPTPVWWPNWGWRREQPEVVAEAEVKLGEDGTFKVPIDTALAKAIHGDKDHRYEITAEVTDQSRRTIVGTGSVLVSRRPFKVYAWVNRGYFRVGDTIQANFRALRLDRKAVEGKGTLKLMRVTYDKDLKPLETAVQTWELDTDDEGKSAVQIKASKAGQYRLSYTVTDKKKHTIEGGYVFVIRGEGFDGRQFRFNHVELVTDKPEYKPGEKVRLMVNTEQADSTVLLFLRPSNGVYLPPKVLRIAGKSAVEAVDIIKKDMPNIFIEAVTVSRGKVHREVREVIVPPENRVLDVKVIPSAKRYRPGEKATVKIKLTEPNGEPYVGSTVVAMYDKAVEYISGGSNVQKIKEFFWKWRRRHNPRGETSLTKGSSNLLKKGEIGMGFLGIFGHLVADEPGPGGAADKNGLDVLQKQSARGGFGAAEGMMMDASAEMAVGNSMAPGAPMMKSKSEAGGLYARAAGKKGGGGGGAGAPLVQPTVRTKFADTAYWAAALTTGKDGIAEIKLTMPENLTTWTTRVWAMGDGARCGEGSAESVTAKDLIIRLQAPRFFVQKDEVVLSANVHNYLKTKKTVTVVLDLGGKTLEIMGRGKSEQTIEIPAQGEKRVDWRVKVLEPGEAIVTMKALTDEESDAMQMTFPVYVHGMLKTESFCGVIRPKGKRGKIDIRVPAERRPKESRLEIRYSPTLAGAMVDALPYLTSYPYGCTEQTLNRFLPTVITQKVLIRMGLDLADIKQKRTNLNAQEIGKDVERAKQWKRWKHNPVFDQEKVTDMVKAGLERLGSMQCSDGGWGWFSGRYERSYPHTTAVVIHGLRLARDNDVAVVPGVFDRGVAWLKRYQKAELKKLQNAASRTKPWKDRASALDALVYMVLVDEKSDSKPMREFLYRDRNGLAVYAKAMLGLACHKMGDTEKRDMLIRNVEQYLVQDDENQTAYLNLPNSGWWWYWYGSEYEAHAYYLKLLAATDPKGAKASRIVKYLLNNRKHATYWKSTRDTAVCVEAFADYIKASGEDKPDMTVDILVDGKKAKTVKINRDNLFVYDNKLVLTGEEVTTGKHTIELVRRGTGPLYYNAYLTNFTLEDPITRAGLEIKVNRTFYKLVPVDKKIKVAGSRGQAVDQKVEKYERVELKNLDTLTSGDLVEVELEIDSKNDYEYIMFEDMKAAGFEPVSIRSGYTRNGMGAYMELRDERVALFVRWLARGKHSISYRVRAEIPGRFSALPAKASAMYAPELKANSDEIKLQIKD
jgi:alpha-2-macroglobulin